MAARRARTRRVLLLFSVLLGLGLVALFATHDVSTNLTKEDAVYAERMLRDTGYGGALTKAPRSFDDQVRTVLAVQDAVLSTASENAGLPLGAPRELRDLYEAKQGLCYDRSRAIEKILSHLGFQVRHAAVYATTDSNALQALVTPRTRSHAVTEVKTERGWLVIDSNKRWISLTEDGAPLDLGELQEKAVDRRWDARVSDTMSRIFRGSFTYLYGLYSRHGQFYPPYTPVPDLDWNQLPYNFSD
jgi:hypothetical protein